MKRASTGRRREYPGGDSDSDGYRRLHRDQRPPHRGVYPDGRPPNRGGHPDREGYPNRGGRPHDQGGYPGGRPPDGGRGPPGGGYHNRGRRPLKEEDTLVEDPLKEEKPLDLLQDKDHQALKDLLGL